MGKVTYILFDFNASKAGNGSLCVMVNKDYKGSTIVGEEQEEGTSANPENSEEIQTGTRAGGQKIISDNPSEDGGGEIVDEIRPKPSIYSEILEAPSLIDWSKETPQGGVVATLGEDFMGAGICKMIDAGRFAFTIRSITYFFDSKGIATSVNANGWKLMMGVVADPVSEGGSSVHGTYTITNRTRNPEGDIEYTEGETKEADIVVENLNARDQFAIEALKSIIDKVPNPHEISDSEMNLYCTAAYQWAANMMSAAAQTRTVINDETKTSEEEDEEIGALETNTEKLLNNIVSSLRRTDHEVGEKVESGTWHNSNTEWGFVDVIADEDDYSKLYKKVADQEDPSTLHNEPCTSVADAQNNGWSWAERKVPVYAERFVAPNIEQLMHDFVAVPSEPVQEGEPEPEHQTVGLYDLIQAITNGGGGGSTSKLIDVIYKYLNITEAETDGWAYDTTNQLWKKKGYANVSGDYTDAVAKTLLTWKYVQKSSVVELDAVITELKGIKQELHNIATALSNS